MQSYKKEKDFIDHAESHNGMASDGLNAERKTEEWVSEMPPHIKKRTEEWIDYFAKMQFEKQEFKFWKNCSSLFRNRIRGSINVKYLPYWGATVFTFITIAFLAFSLNLQWKMPITISCFIVIVTLLFTLVRARKHIVEIIDPMEFSEREEKHILKLRMFYADELRAGSKYDKALSLYNEITHQFPQAWTAKYSAASCYLSMKKAEIARRKYISLIQELNANNEFQQKKVYLSSCYNQIGNSYEMQNRYEDAYQAFLKALDYRSDHYAIHMNLLLVCVKLGRFGEAKQWFLKLNTDRRRKVSNMLPSEAYQSLSSSL